MRCRKPFWLAWLSLFATALLFAQAPDTDAAKHKPASNAPSIPADIEKGKKLFNSKCAICHFSASPAKKIGPGLRGLLKRGTYADGKPVDDASLRVWIEKGGKNMPGFRDSLNAEQVRDLITYLKTL